MRKNQLRQQVDNYLRLDHRGSPRARKHRHFVLHRIIHDLFKIDFIPAKWHGLTHEHVLKLIQYWQRKKLKSATLRKYMTSLRVFLQRIEHSIDGIDNKSLGIRSQKPSKKVNHFSAEIVQQFSNPIAQILVWFQIGFGLTLSEAMRLIPDIHIKDTYLWVTRNMATNSKDRIIPIGNDEQRKIIATFLTLCHKNKDLISTYNYHFVRCTYNLQLKSLNLSPIKTYRYFYARIRYSELTKLQSNNLTCQTIMQEMGLHSRTTLWSYLHV